MSVENEGGKLWTSYGEANSSVCLAGLFADANAHQRPVFDSVYIQLALSILHRPYC